MRSSKWASRLLIVSCTAAAMFAVTAAPAAAIPPEREAFTDAQTDLLLADCGAGVRITETFTDEVSSIRFLDQSGNEIRDIVHHAFHGVITNSGSGNTYDDNEHLTLAGDFTTGIVRSRGVQATITAPGRGIILDDTGLIRFFGPAPPTPVEHHRRPWPSRRIGPDGGHLRSARLRDLGNAMKGV
jgi:hypothetical protein